MIIIIIIITTTFIYIAPLKARVYKVLRFGLFGGETLLCRLFQREWRCSSPALRK